MKRYILRLLIAVSILSAALFGQSAKEFLKRHVSYLASDELEGRKSGSKGNNKAAQYIADEFAKIGLLPLGDNNTYFQNFEVVSELQLGKKNTFEFVLGKKKTSYTVRKEFQPLGFSLDTTVSGKLVFVGYGISAQDLQYDDYASIDVKNKIVVALRGTPDGDNPHSQFGKFSALRYKAMQARQSGAIGLIIVSPTSEDSTDKLIRLKYDNSFSNSGIAAVNVTRKVVNSWFPEKRLNVDSLQASINRNKQPNSFALEKSSISLSTEVIEIRKPTQNVIGILKVPHPKDTPYAISDEHLIVGAHFDHLGYDGDGSGSLKPFSNEIHNGADDNASGTSAMIEIARNLAVKKETLKRHIVFMGFSGEEMGLLGSSHYTKSPLLPLEQAITMINLDMVGRLKENKLTVQGTGTSMNWETMLQSLNTDSTFHFAFVKDGFGPSDHASFYSKNIPVLFFFTGVHEDYHKPSDDFDKLNYDGMENIVTFVSTIATVIDTTSAKPEFQKTEMQMASAGSGRGFRATLGTVPDYSEGVVGFKISDVRESSPAAKAGMKGGDIIVKLGKYDIKSIYDYMYALEGFKPGEEAEVIFQRGIEKITAKVTFEKRN